MNSQFESSCQPLWLWLVSRFWFPCRQAPFRTWRESLSICYPCWLRLLCISLSEGCPSKSGSWGLWWSWWKKIPTTPRPRPQQQYTWQSPHAISLPIHTAGWSAETQVNLSGSDLSDTPLFYGKKRCHTSSSLIGAKSPRSACRHCSFLFWAMIGWHSFWDQSRPLEVDLWAENYCPPSLEFPT